MLKNSSARDKTANRDQVGRSQARLVPGSAQNSRPWGVTANEARGRRVTRARVKVAPELVVTVVFEVRLRIAPPTLVGERFLIPREATRCHSFDVVGPLPYGLGQDFPRGCLMYSGRKIGGLMVVGALTVVGAFAILASTARAATVRRVPLRYATIQQAIDAANPGDEISVAPGRYCGAVIDRTVTLDGHGEATIVGCPTGPELFGGLRVGFILPGISGDNQASGTRIQGFHFDGRGVTASDLDPLAFGVFARFANDIQIIGNRFFGTVQAITNTAGDRWVIAHNDIHGLTLFDCSAGLCGGGDGISIQTASGDVAAAGGPGNAVNRPEGNIVFANNIDGTIPDGFDTFSMGGIVVFAADQTTVRENRIAIPDNPKSEASGEGVLISNNCGETPAHVVPGSRDTIVVFNEGSASEFIIVVEGTGGENAQALVLFGNRGVQLIEGTVVAETSKPDRHRHPRRLAAHRGLHL